jgi:hypothetical protein
MRFLREIPLLEVAIVLCIVGILVAVAMGAMERNKFKQENHCVRTGNSELEFIGEVILHKREYKCDFGYKWFSGE